VTVIRSPTPFEIVAFCLRCPRTRLSVAPPGHTAGRAATRGHTGDSRRAVSAHQAPPSLPALERVATTGRGPS
jgi:hypothetical protein